MKTAAEPFKLVHGSGWKPTAAMADPASYPVRIEVPAGPITLEGTRRNVRMVIERLFATLPVLSHLEIARGIQIKSLGTIS